MPYGTPQSMMYNMRGRGTDGGMIRNRSREQQFTPSGNPNMPIFNTAPSDMRGGNPRMTGGPMPQFPQAPKPGIPGQPQGMGSALGGSPAPTPQMSAAWYANRDAQLARARGPITPSAGSAATYNYNYNQPPGVSPFAAAIAAMHQKPPIPAIDTSRAPTGYAPPPAPAPDPSRNPVGYGTYQPPVDTSRNPNQYAPMPAMGTY